MTLLEIFVKQNRFMGPTEIAVGALLLIGVFLLVKSRKATGIAISLREENSKLKEEVKALERKVEVYGIKVEELEKQLEDCVDPLNLCGNYIGSIETLKQSQARYMITNYRGKQLAAINSNLTFYNSNGSDSSDSESIVFTLERLKSFIFHIEKKVINCFGGGAQGRADMPKLGIKFYFASYPRNSDECPEDWDKFRDTYNQNNESGVQDYLEDCYQGRQTLVMVPTYENGNNEYVDFDSNISLSPSDLSLGNSKLDYIDTTSSHQVSAANHGSLYPPMQ